MGFDVEKIFLPSVGVDLVFNMDSETPISKSSIIYDTDYKNKTITIAQPVVPISKDTSFDQLHLTTLIQAKQRKSRIGINCRPIQFIENYPLANGALTKALVVKYDLPAIETNIRSAFRLSLGLRYTIKAKLLFNKQEYRTPKDFRVKDVSFAGIGIVVHKKKGKDVNPLLALKRGTSLAVGLALIDSEQKEPVGILPLKTRVARINHKYSDAHTLIGLKISDISLENESILNQFIHEAQVDELKRISKKG
ncbi:MAG: PilZ domain-containing protein [Desulfobacterales bacterium]|nr:PilZ domain-containing protein [Desulfobacterales bacterium]